MAAQDQTRLYEGMFLLRQEAVANDFGGCVEFLRTSFDRAGAEVLVLRRWDERRLAMDIKGQRRGVFLLAYFNAGGASVTGIERDCALSEHVLRCLIIRADHIGEAELAEAAADREANLGAERPDEAAASAEPPAAEAVEAVAIEAAGTEPEAAPTPDAAPPPAAEPAADTAPAAEPDAAVADAKPPTPAPPSDSPLETT